MTFDGCKGAPCKCAAVGLGCWCVVALANHDQFCGDWGQHRGAYLRCRLGYAPRTAQRSADQLGARPRNSRLIDFEQQHSNGD
jgi:hypothetical protein